MCSTATATLKVKYIRENTDWNTTTDISKFPLDIENPKFTGDAASATNTRQAQLTRSHMYSPPYSTSLQVLLREYSAHDRCLWFLPIARVHILHTASMSNALARYWYCKSGTTKEFTNIKAMSLTSHLGFTTQSPRPTQTTQACTEQASLWVMHILQNVICNHGHILSPIAAVGEHGMQEQLAARYRHAHSHAANTAATHTIHVLATTTIRVRAQQIILNELQQHLRPPSPSMSTQG